MCKEQKRVEGIPRAQIRDVFVSGEGGGGEMGNVGGGGQEEREMVKERSHKGVPARLL